MAALGWSCWSQQIFVEWKAEDLGASPKKKRILHIGGGTRTLGCFVNWPVRQLESGKRQGVIDFSFFFLLGAPRIAHHCQVFVNKPNLAWPLHWSYVLYALTPAEGFFRTLCSSPDLARVDQTVSWRNILAPAQEVEPILDSEAETPKVISRSWWGRLNLF